MPLDPADFRRRWEEAPCECKPSDDDRCWVCMNRDEMEYELLAALAEVDISGLSRPGRFLAQRERQQLQDLTSLARFVTGKQP